MNMPSAIDQSKVVINRFSEAEGMSMAAALAYYTLFAMPPLLFILVNVVSLGMSTYYEGEVANEKARDFLQSTVAELVGNANAGQEVGKIIERSALQTGIGWKMLVSLAAILVGATGLVHALQSSLNRIWGVRVEVPLISLLFLWKRVFSLAMLLAFGLMLVISFVISTLINAIGGQISQYLATPELVPLVANFSANVVVSWFFFTSIFKLMPDTTVSWRAAIYGGTLTLLLFMIGRGVLSLYLSISEPGQQLGSAAAALLVMIVWIYYSYAILLMGAAYTFSLQTDPIVPDPGAISVETVPVESLPDESAGEDEEQPRHGTHTRRNNGELI